MNTDRTPGEGRYSRVEREQRWLLPLVPDVALLRAEITDHYFVNTSLRLRSVTSRDSTTLKLTQKIRVDELDPEVVKITNLYLSPHEYEMLLKLPASTIQKNRYDLQEGRVIFAVDEFLGRLRGLVMAEIELLENDERVSGPRSALVEVTNDQRFSGGSLANVTKVELTNMLAPHWNGTSHDEP